MNPHAVTGADHDAEKAPDPTSRAGDGTDNLTLDDSDTESVTDHDLIPDTTPSPSSGAVAPPTTQPSTLEPTEPEPVPPPSDVSDPAPFKENTTENEDPGGTAPSTTSPKAKELEGSDKSPKHKYNLRDRKNRRSWKDLYKRAKRSASKSLERVKGAGRKRS